MLGACSNRNNTSSNQNGTLLTPIPTSNINNSLNSQLPKDGQENKETDKNKQQEPSKKTESNLITTKENSKIENNSTNRTLTEEAETRIKYAKMVIQDESNNPKSKDKLEKILKLEEEYKTGKRTAKEVIDELDKIKNSN